MPQQRDENGKTARLRDLPLVRIIEWVLIASASAVMGLGTYHFQTIIHRLDVQENRTYDVDKRLTIVEQTYMPAKELYLIFNDIAMKQAAITGNQTRLLADTAAIRTDMNTLTKEVTRHIAADEKGEVDPPHQ